jgi:hypothetical protein
MGRMHQSNQRVLWCITNLPMESNVPLRGLDPKECFSNDTRIRLDSVLIGVEMTPFNITHLSIGSGE